MGLGKHMLKAAAASLALAASPAWASGAADTPAPASTFKTYPAIPEAPKGAPNILLVMTDDVGFGVSSTFGGAVPMPNYDALAARGLRYNNFYTASLCSPTRAALLTGRNHHNVGYGALAEMATDEAGYSGVIPDSAATIGKVLQANGYDTSWFGKNHNTPPWESSPFGPFNHWPMGMGFSYFYGFNGAETDQFRPALVENLNTVRPFVGKPDYILDRDLADHAVQWLDLHQSIRADHPFLMYLAPGTAHDPNQAPKEWLEKFRGKFDMGWDKLREETYRKQKAMGIIPASAKLTPRPKEIPAWDSLTKGQQQVAARMMEAHAAQLAFFDDQFGRVVAELKRLGQYDNTLIIYIQGDNGASEEYGVEGALNNYAMLNNNSPTPQEMEKSLNDIGTRASSLSIPAGWAYAMNSPFPWSKEIASHLGGLKDGMVVSWPARIQGHGEIRPQFAHVIDVAPTLYQIVGITPPAEVDGKAQMPLDGTSFAYTFTDASAPSRHREQYFEILGNRAYYKDGWFANTTPPKPSWVHGSNFPDPKDYHWELYNLNDDFSQSTDLAAKYPAKLAELQADFAQAAEKYHVNPMRSDFFTRLPPELRPSVMNYRKSATYYPSDTRYITGMFPNISGSSWRATATIDVPQAGGDGTLVAQGGWPMGWGLFVIDGKPTFIYRQSDHNPEFRLTGAALSPGKHVIEGRFTLDQAPGQGGTVSLTVDGVAAGDAHVDKRWTFINLPGSVGMLGDDAISDDHQPPFAYQGKLDHVTITVEPKK